MELPPEVEHILEIALAEDTASGDVTSQVLIPIGLEGQAMVLVKAQGVMAGIEVLRSLFLMADPSLEVVVLVEDGQPIAPGDIVATVSGRVTSILKAERVALNFIQRLSGIASQTADFVARVSGSQAIIVDTRKTTPGLRWLEKYAVRSGGGQNHRFHMGDGILIKDNHLAALRSIGMSLGEIVTKARSGAPPGLSVEVEVTSFEEAREALAAGADTIMLDNMPPDEMRPIVAFVAGRARLEASGGIRLENVREIAATGVDIISIGALTHSVKALDISLELETVKL
ncbi:MAG: carboxylating nicotinate-nucleotide diphosphorylase [Dehalococcoidales bacterium]|jgi:nicotinate-nucleotide pyrophosphorylase (carboxylating)